MRLSILLFDGFTALDVVGGYEMLANVPGMEVEFVAQTKGVIAADTRSLGMAAWRDFTEVRETGILYVPGGPGVVAALNQPALIEWVRLLDATSKWSVGICNGVAILAAAGLLQGKTATTNWSWRERITAYGVEVSTERYYRDGKYVTGAGVSASIDTGLFLAGLIAGKETAQTIQLGVEYYPAPPFGSAGADAMPQAMRAMVRKFEEYAQERLRETKPAFPGQFGHPPAETFAR